MESDRRYASRVRGVFDATWSRLYRQLEEQASDDATEHYGMLLARISSSFDRSIDVLDIGCGTGRYFYRLCNVRRLVGLDLSQDMLDQARSPVHALDIHADSIELVCGELHSTVFAEESFDFVYSVGVMGEYSPLNEEFFRLCMRMLKPGGVLFVTAVDTVSRVSVPENNRPSLWRRVLRKAWPLLPSRLLAAVNRWLSPYYLRRDQLDKLFTVSGISSVEITSYSHKSGWLGTHFDCIAVKDDG